MSDKKTKKQTPQQIFNQFLFESMVDKLRAVELYEKEVAGFSKQISQHISDHKVNSAKEAAAINDLFKKFEELKGQYGGYNFGNRVEALEEKDALSDSRIHHDFKEIESLKTQFKGLEKSYADTIRTFELKMKEQRGDYHDHIAQLVRENAAAHETINTRLSELKQHDDVSRECGNNQAREILKMQEQIKGLEHRLSRAQDMIAEYL